MVMVPFRVFPCGVGMAMVPFADLFNHKAAVVELAGGYFVEDVCMDGTASPSDEEFDDPDDDSGDAMDTKACQNGAAGDSSGDVHRSGDEQASTEVNLTDADIARGKENFWGGRRGGGGRGGGVNTGWVRGPSSSTNKGSL